MTPTVRLPRGRTLALAIAFVISTFTIPSPPARPVDGDPLGELVSEVQRAIAPKPARAAFCASNPGFNGRLTSSSSSTTQLEETTTGQVYGYISLVGAAWSCDAYYRYTGLGWNITSNQGRINWGNLINSTSVPCNWVVGETNYAKGNSTNDCHDSDAEYAMQVQLSAERIYQTDVNHDDIGDLSFTHSDCGTYYGGTVASGSESTPRNFDPDNTYNRPGDNCDPITLDHFGSSQQTVYDGTAPAIGFDWPTAGGPTLLPSAFAVVQFDATDNVADFGGSDDWDLQRQIATWNGSVCGTFANDSGTDALVSGTTDALDQESVQGIGLGSCYRWTLAARDENGNVATTVTSGSVRTDTTGMLGDQPQFRAEGWDLGGGDTLSVSAGSGNVRLDHPIVSLPIRSGSLDLSLHYNSHDTATIGVGTGWRLNVQRRLAVNGDGSVTFTDADGSRHTFTSPTGSPTVSYTRPATLYATLSRDTAATPDRFTLTYRDQSKDVFDEDLSSTGLLKQIKDRHGNTVSVTYTGGTAEIDKLTDPAGREIDFTWSSGKLSTIVDWANVDGGIVQTSGSGDRTNTFVYSGSLLLGWGDALYTSGTCPTGASHLTCLTYSSNLLATVAKTQTYETESGGTLGSSTRTVTTTVAYEGYDVTSVTDAEAAQTTFHHDTQGETRVVRPGTPASETTYRLVSASDDKGRITSVKRKLGASTWIETETTYDTTYPIEPATVKQNKGGGALEHVTNFTYQASSLALLSRLDAPLDGTYRHYTDYTYNANNDVTQVIASRQGDGTLRRTTRYCYTTSGCSTSATDLLLRATIENYVDGTAGGSNGHVEDVTTAFEYDANNYGLLTKETRSNYSGSTLLDSAATGWTYDANGNQTAEIRNYANGTVTDPGDDITPNGSTNARTDLTTAFGYDTAGNRVSTADPRRAIATALGQSPGTDDYVSRTVFDALNQATIEQLPTTPSGGDCTPASATCRQTQTTYDELGLVREARDVPDVVTATVFDKVGRVLKTYQDPPSGSAFQTSASTYDAQGRLLTSKDERQVDDATLGVTANTYDELGRVTQVIEADGSSPDIESITRRVYDNLDRLTEEEVGYVAASDAGQITTYTYDIGGRVTAVDDEFTCATTTYDWRGLAQVAKEGLPTGSCSGSALREITHSYDGLGRLTQREITAGEGDNDILGAPSYDAAGRQLTTSATTGGDVSASTFTLNPLDQLIAETRTETPSGGSPTTVSWTKTNLDPAGNQTDRCVWTTNPSSELCKSVGQSFTTTPAVHTTTAYDARNNRTSLKLPGLGETTYTAAHNYQIENVYVPLKLDGSGNVTHEHQTLYTYDSRHRLDTITQQTCTISSGHACSSTTATVSNDYAYDDDDNRTQVVEHNGAGSSTKNYCYDGLDRLRAMKATTSCTLTSGDETFTYDDAGNRTHAAGTDFAYDSEGQLCKVGGTSCTGANVTYDDAGRTLTYAGWTYTYDGEGRLQTACKVALCATGDKVESRYDADGRRVELVTRPNGGSDTTVTFKYHAGAIAQELTGSSLSRTYVTDADGAIVKICDPDCTGSNPQYLVTWNGHGDASALWRIESTGSLTLANSFTYTSWGSPTTTTHNSIADLGFRFLYVGRYGVAWDNAFGLGLHYMSARHYSPALGRFLQPDPSALEANLYGYAAGNPVTMVDPSGNNPAAAGCGFLAPALPAAAGCVAVVFLLGLAAAGGIALALPKPVIHVNTRTSISITRAEIRRYLRRNSLHCFVIGEPMDRVLRYATKKGCSTMPDLPKDWPSDKKMMFNAAWVLGEMLQRKLLYDCGPQYVMAPRKYYRMEKAMTFLYSPRRVVWSSC